MTARACALAVAVVLAVAPSAWGATTAEVVYEPAPGTSDDPTYLRVTSGDERNVITVDTDRSVHDDAAPVFAGEGCEQVDPNTVRCDPFTVLEVSAGGGDDEVSAALVSARSDLRGGPGDDELDVFGFEPNLLVGGPGADVLAGGPGRLDVAEYGARTVGVSASLNRTADDGEPGEGDDVRDEVDVLAGGAGDDVLDLGESPVTEGAAYGRNGADRLEAGPGGQRLVGGRGPDLLVGGDGDDVLDDDGCGPQLIFYTFPCIGEGADVLAGGGGGDELHGQSDDDRLDGGPGDDLLEGGTGADDVLGGDDVDTAATDIPAIDLTSDTPNPPAPVTVTVDDRADDGGERDRRADNVRTDIEQVLGTTAADVLIGSPGIETLRGGGGGDVLDGLGGPDHLFGDDGDDSLRARDGETDLLHCGNGLDGVVADPVDDTGPTCELRDIAAPPVPVTTVAFQDLVRPSVKVTGAPRRIRRSTLIRRGLRLTLTPSERASIELSLTRNLARARRARAGDLELAARRVSVASGSARVRLRVPRALRRHVPRRGGRLRLEIRAEDRAGNVTVLRRTVRVR